LKGAPPNVPFITESIIGVLRKQEERQNGGLQDVLTVQVLDSASLHAQVLGAAEYLVLPLSILSIPSRVISVISIWNKRRPAKPDMPKSK
jgi:hypothetical protein